MMAKVHWRDVPLCRGRRASEAVAVGPDDPTRVTLLREHRLLGRMADGWVCTPEDLSLLEGHEAAMVLPGPDEIDWTGFPD
jgi:hypothetical protein